MKKFNNILVAFDLNKTLFFKTESPLPRMHHSKVKKLFFYLRPHIKQLIDYLHANKINYCFWSNMIGKNCLKYVKQLEGVGMKNYCGIFDQQFCDKAQNMAQLGQKVKSIKNLHKLAALFKVDVDKCVLVDDSKQKNYQGCNLIHVSSYEGQEVDKQLLSVIEQLKQFRKEKLDENDQDLTMLKYTEYNFQPELDNIVIPKKVEKVEKKHQPTALQLQIENDPQLKKLKADLVAEKQNRKNIMKEIQTLQKSTALMAEEIKKQSEGKVVRKGDQLLVQVLMFAKNKKAAEKKLEELQKSKKNSEEKIAIIKKIMRIKVQQLNPHALQLKQDETKDETPDELCSKKNIKISENSKQSVPQAEEKTTANEAGQKEEEKQVPK